MPVSYTKEQRERAKADGGTLVAVAVGGMEFVGPVGQEEAERVMEFLLGMFARQRAAGQTAKPKEG